MVARFDLEVDVNGEEVFMVDKRVLSCYSGKVNKLFSESKDDATNMKLIFHDFPGGAANFEVITRFCYNKGKANINPCNISSLICAAHFMEMNRFVAGTDNLYEQAQKSLEDVNYWTWSEVLVALKQCQNLLPGANSSGILNRYLDSVNGRIVSSCETSPCLSTSSLDSSGFRPSSEPRSPESLRNTCFRAAWWFDDLVALHVPVIEMLVRMMVSRSFSGAIISKFLFYYLKTRLASASPDEKTKTFEAAVEMLYSLDIRCVSDKSLFDMLRVSLNMKVNESCRNKLVSMIGLLFDQATLDNLLVPSPARKKYLYDVNLVLSFLRSFLGKGACYIPLNRQKKVASLMDLYLAEIAPDPYLKSSKFLAAIRALPDSARDFFDGVYHAVNLYLEVHKGLSEEQKMKLCSGLNYEKLSAEATNHLTQNANLPSKYVSQVIMFQQSKLKSLLQDTGNASTTGISPPKLSEREHKGRTGKGCQQIVLYVKKFHLSDESEKLKAHLQRMQWRVLELEKVCRRMQVQMTKMAKSRLSSHGRPKTVPKLCSE